MNHFIQYEAEEIFIGMKKQKVSSVFFIFKLIPDNVLAMRLGFYESCIYLSHFFIKEKKIKLKLIQ